MRKNFIRDFRLSFKYTSDIQTFDRKPLKVGLCQNKLLAKPSNSFRGICSLCNINMSSLKVPFFVHFMLQCHLYYNITFCVPTSIMNNVTWRYKHQQQCTKESFSSANYLTYNMSVICCQNSGSQNILEMHSLV